jgi:hypothetical protein
MCRYAAKLLFQFRVTTPAGDGKRRTCEERIVLIEVPTARKALAQANRRGKAAAYRYVNDEGNPVRFEFVGVLELIGLGIECGDDEAWYDITERLSPMERKAEIIPSDSQLCAIRNESVRPSRARPGG